MREKVKDPESVAEHSFRVGVLAMVLSNKLEYKLDKEKLMKMALLHDLAEVVTGDMVTARWSIIDVKKVEEKEKEEKREIKKMFDIIGEGDGYGDIFDEMVSRITPEAKVFWQLDKLEMAIQALEYEQEQGKNLDEFFVTADLYIKEANLREIFDEIMIKRENRRKEISKHEGI
ncbi:HD domain-containing protein [Patescibacteria group bacterium]|nr:HD domain-containing protein [Patescibacteria group bacterium]